MWTLVDISVFLELVPAFLPMLKYSWYHTFTKGFIYENDETN